MSEEEVESSSENEMQRLAKKLKSDVVQVNIDPQTDITLLAIERYDELKKNYNFVSFEEADKSKTYTTCKTEAFSLPINDFSQEMYSFRRNGYCADPDSTTKGLVFSTKLKDFKQKSELKG